MIYNNVLEAMGHTPMIRLNRMNSPENAEVLVKYEGLNVGGSIKTRTAFNMIEEAKKQGRIHEDTIIVEPTSGNQGIGLALIGAVQGYKTVIFMPDSVSEERRKLVQHYGAEVRLVHDAGNIGDCIDECLRLALEMARENPKVFVPQQFENPANPDGAPAPYGAGNSGTGRRTDSRFLLRYRDRRNDYRYRRGTEGSESGDGDLGCGAGKCSHTCRRNGGNTSADGHWRRGHPSNSE